ncbi:MBL fold metallo-hydrolase [Steroidobacter sp.]|uniref:MBL fold metallo-hydrolase n=1 Tax=Steroidobacter sp. TaxID=1978227 RepID=UPI001A3F609B|nr:MBL fold metallo-hydrolase [Steroidobacter sp.]MBL8267568.1 MBL fold metallo-hydrolase [Steroidobacter sp.]
MSTACSNPPSYRSSQFRDGQFHNAVSPKQPGGWQVLKLWWQFMFKDTSRTVPPTGLTVVPLTGEQLEQAPDGSIYRLGHSTVLMKLNGKFWITDPVFAERASPVQWAGPKRFTPTPISLAELPPLAAVVLSHDHFDHLDRETVIALAAKTNVFLAPLGVGDQLIRWGIPASKTHQLDWWQTIELEGIQFTATPAQHFSGRSVFAKNPTLWASWVIYTGTHRIYFSGDTGYFDGFAEIGRRHGPFDLTLLEAGAYDKQWEGVHMLPQQVMQAHRDLGGDWLLPIHNATFDLAFHSWDEPMEKMLALSAQQDIRLTMPRIGEAVRLGQYQRAQPWWRVKESRTTPANVHATASS